MVAAARILFIGCGKMGGALLKGAVKGNASTAICVVDPAPPQSDLKTIANVSWISSPDAIEPAFKPDVVIVAVKPQQIEKALPPYGRFGESVFLSIAAGVTIERLEALLKGPHAIVRSMPNLPASIGQGISCAVANRHSSPAQQTLCDTFLKAGGETVWVDDENLLDTVTALSANGPAYVFALCETMAQAGEKLGLPADTAMKLARQTVIGSAALLAQSPESASALRAAVTSPGGTTEAALKYLLATPDGLPGLMLKAMTAGTQRARELSGVKDSLPLADQHVID